MRKKVLSLLTTLCMVFMLLATTELTVLALAPTDTQQVTVTGLTEGTTVNAYKVIDLNITENGSIQEPIYLWKANVAEWVEINYKKYIGENYAVTKDFLKLKDDKDESKTFWQDLGKYIYGSETITADKSTTVSTGQTTVTLDLNMGEYVLLANGGTNKIYLPATAAVLPAKNAETGDFELANTSTITMKGEDIGVDKTIPDKDEQSVGVGSVVHYEVKNTIPVYPDNVEENSIMYKIGDKMSAGLTFNGTVEVVVENQTITAEGNYELITTGLTNADFEIIFTQAFLFDNAGKEITLKYSATVNGDAVTETDPLDNTVTLTYSHDPYNANDHKTITDKETVYTYNLQFDKLNKSDEKLTDAEFELYKEDSTAKINLIKEGEGSYRLAEKDEQGAVITMTSITGIFTVKGLDTGVYVLKETKSPNGYVLPADSTMKITLADAEPDGVLDKDSTKVEASGITIKEGTMLADQASFSFDIVNETPDDLNLPVTGGSGIMIFALAGVAVMSGAVLLYLSGRRKSNMK